VTTPSDSSVTVSVGSVAGSTGTTVTQRTPSRAATTVPAVVTVDSGAPTDVRNPSRPSKRTWTPWMPASRSAACAVCVSGGSSEFEPITLTAAIMPPSRSP
jgi:hypothetical protein